MKKNIYAITALLFITISCRKETEVTPSFVSQSSQNMQSAAKHFIGEHFGGGIIFYLDQRGKHGLIAAALDFDEAAIWSWKDTLNGAKDTALGAGALNTNRIVQIQGFPQFIEEYAALGCLQSIINGYQDWYLPSLSELNLMYQNKTIIGGFQNFSYWTSSESDATKAWLINFRDGSRFVQVKTGGYSVRPIRRF
ncbi:MAG TPA: DUF1566 domain-containing protein [Chitinophagaceae bacterium]|nr:DUF1566 domain-containing protein [Chitinophagaceae bacterium]